MCDKEYQDTRNISLAMMLAFLLFPAFCFVTILFGYVWTGFIVMECVVAAIIIPSFILRTVFLTKYRRYTTRRRFWFETIGYIACLIFAIGTGFAVEEDGGVFSYYFLNIYIQPLYLIFVLVVMGYQISTAKKVAKAYTEETRRAAAVSFDDRDSAEIFGNGDNTIMINKPLYHFAPAKNWMNDPNGTVYRDGVYHLFYQYNPNGIDWGDIHWAYATSRDLVNWQRKGVRLRPETERGEKHCFSGCAAVHGDGFLMAYTSVGFEEDASACRARQRFALADRNFENIERLYEKDLTEKSQPFPVREWRDPFIFEFEGERFLLTCGVVCADGQTRNSVMLYCASGALDWRYVGLLAVEDELIECPNLFIENGRAALLYSACESSGAHTVKYISGIFDGKTLKEIRRGYVDLSRSCLYATNISESADGGHVMYGWLREDLDGSTSADGVTSGCLAVRKIYIDEDYGLRFAPVDALAALEAEELPYENGAVGFGGARARLRFSATDGSVFRIVENSDEYVEIELANGELAVEARSAFRGARQISERARLDEKSEYSFDILTDGSVVEIFIDGRGVFTLRAYRAARAERLFSLKKGAVSALRAVGMRAADITGE